MKSLPPERRFLLVLLLGLVPFLDVQACGPDFRPDVFVRPLQPDDHAGYARGELALLQPTFVRTDLIVAYRYLAGGRLSPAEQAAYFTPSKVLTEEQNQIEHAKEEAAQPVRLWMEERAKYSAGSQKSNEVPGQTQSFPNPDEVWRYSGEFVNCPDDAFRTAVLTLTSRAKTFGHPSVALSEWLAGQDAVFANCEGHSAVVPVGVGAVSPALLRADRAYQIAAASFYAEKFEEARRGFEAIALDPSSPWQTYGGYLAARCLIRQASLARVGPSTNDTATFDMTLLLQAQRRLEELLHDPVAAKMRHAIRAELNFVRLRTERGERMRELAAALAGPKPDPDFKQDLIDLTFALDQRLDETDLRVDSDFAANPPDPPSDAHAERHGQAYLAAADLRKPSPLVDWLLTFQSPSEDARQHALREWRETKSLPWLTAAMTKATAKDAETPALLTAAAEVLPVSPAAMIMAFHRARLLIALNRQDEARTLLDGVLPAIRKTDLDSAANAFLGLRMQTARTLREFLTYAPRKLLERNSQAALTADCEDAVDDTHTPRCPGKIEAVQLDLDAATALNLQFPLELLIAAAKAPELPASLRQSVAIAAWVRSVLLDDAAAAKELVPLLPAEVAKTAGDSIGFPATLAMLRNPGIQPYLDAGVQRSLSYRVFDDYRNNWWCGNWNATWSGGGAFGNPLPSPPVSLPFLTAVERTAATSDLQRLVAQTDPGAVFLGQRALAYAKEHPDDPDLPEALARTVRATHLGCGTQETEAKRLATAKAAFQLLHRRYANSIWAKRTKVYG